MSSVKEKICNEIQIVYLKNYFKKEKQTEILRSGRCCP